MANDSWEPIPANDGGWEPIGSSNDGWEPVGGPTRPSSGNGFTDYAKRFGSELATQYGEFGRAVGRTASQAAAGIAEMQSRYTPTGLISGLAERAITGGQAAPFTENLRQSIKDVYPQGNAADPLTEIGGQMAATTLPAMAAPQAYAPVVGGLLAGGLGYTTARDQGATPNQALGSAAIQGAAGAAMARIPHATSLPRAVATAYLAPKAGELANYAYERATYNPNAPTPQLMSEQDIVNTAVGTLAYAGPRIPAALTARTDMLNARAEQARAAEYERQMRVGNEFESQQRAAEQRFSQQNPIETRPSMEDSAIAQQAAEQAQRTSDEVFAQRVMGQPTLGGDLGVTEGELKTVARIQAERRFDRNYPPQESTVPQDYSLGVGEEANRRQQADAQRIASEMANSGGMEVGGAAPYGEDLAQSRMTREQRADRARQIQYERQLRKSAQYEAALAEAEARFNAQYPVERTGISTEDSAIAQRAADVASRIDAERFALRTMGMSGLEGDAGVPPGEARAVQDRGAAPSRGDIGQVQQDRVSQFYNRQPQESPLPESPTGMAAIDPKTQNILSAQAAMRPEIPPTVTTTGNERYLARSEADAQRYVAYRNARMGGGDIPFTYRPNTGLMAGTFEVVREPYPTTPERPQSRQEPISGIPPKEPPKTPTAQQEPPTAKANAESAYATADEVSAAMAAEGVTPEQASASIAKLQEARNAANERVQPEGNLGQREGTDTGGARTQAGDSNRPAAGGQAEVGQQGQGQDVGLFGQTPTPKPPKGVRNRGFVDIGEVGPAVEAAGKKVIQLVKPVAESVDKLLSRFSESLGPRIAELGGAEAKSYARDALAHEGRVKELLGENSPALDPALKVAGRASAYTKWANSDSTNKGYYGINNWVRAAEGKIPVPENFATDQATLDTGNRAIGKMAEGTLFDKATGKVQRMPTREQMEIILDPKNPNRETLIKAKADAGKVPESVVRQMMDEVKTLADQNDYEAAFRRVSQEFTRGLDEVPSWIMGKNGKRIDLYHHQAYDYLTNASTRVAARVAYRQIFGDDATANARRQKVMAELPTAQAEEVTRLSRSMHGLAEPNETVDTLAGDVANIKGRRATKAFFNTLSGMNLGLSAIGNTTEIATGVAPRAVGVKTMAEAIKNVAMNYRETQNANEIAGNINKAIYDWSANPNHPIATFVRRLNNVQRMANLTTVLNEFTGLVNAEAGRITAKNMAEGNLGSMEATRIGEIAKQMGFTPDEAKAMVAGKASPELYKAFAQKFPSFATGENKLLSEGSRFSTNRLASTFFRFQNYPIIQINALRKAALGIVKEGQTPRERMANAQLLARHVGGLTLSGAAANLLMAFVTGGTDKMRTRAEEGIDQPLTFLVGSLARGIGGIPVTLATEALAGGNPEAMAKALFKSSNPLTNVNEVWDSLAGTGRYAGMDKGERLKELLINVNPAFKAGRFWLSTQVMGKDESLQNAASAVRRFKAVEGIGGSGSGPSNDEAVRFRKLMRDVAEAGTTIGTQDPSKVHAAMRDKIMEAMRIKAGEGKDPYNAVAESIRAKKILTGLNNKQLEALRKRIGDKTFRDAQTYDAALQAMSEAF